MSSLISSFEKFLRGFQGPFTSVGCRGEYQIQPVGESYMSLLVWRWAKGMDLGGIISFSS